MRVYFRDMNPTVTSALGVAFADVGAVSTWAGGIFDGPPADAIISPANSRGWMDGGIDLVYVRRWGWQLQDKARSAAAVQPEGLLPVGRALAFPTGGTDIPWLIMAPTMQDIGPIVGTDNVYLAFRAALGVALDFNFGSVLCPGLGTLTGMIVPIDAAEQMRRAWDEVM